MMIRFEYDMMLLHSLGVWDEKVASENGCLASKCFSTSDLYKTSVYEKAICVKNVSVSTLGEQAFI